MDPTTTAPTTKKKRKIHDVNNSRIVEPQGSKVTIDGQHFSCFPTLLRCRLLGCRNQPVSPLPSGMGTMSRLHGVEQVHLETRGGA